MAQLLLELFCEDIPARMQSPAARDLARLAGDRLAAADLAFESLRAFAGPRRLTLLVEGLPTAQDDRVEERKGPRVGAPQAAIEGFARSAGAARDALTIRDGAYFSTTSRPGRPAGDIIAEIMPALVRAFPWPKSMTWAGGSLRWVRPLHRIACVFDRQVVPFIVEGVTAADLSQGHRFMGERQPFSVHDFDQYRQALAAHFVVLDAEERKTRIAAGAGALCAAQGLELVEDEALLEEVAGMAEWPVPILGRMDGAFLDLPPEVIRTSMRTHQRYFAVRRPDGALAPAFVAVADIEASDGGALVAAGNARVLTARLQDARFFWDEDRKTTLESRLQRLKGVIFHDKLGTLYDRALRIETLATDIARRIGADPVAAGEAGRLAKADLASAMVGEFPELQGVMGAHYAAHEGLDASVAQAIGDHYRPLGPSDGVPKAPVSVAVALADKLDSLVAFFAIAEKPTGSRDPFALRRAALGVIRLILDNRVRLALAPEFYDLTLKLLKRQILERRFKERLDKLGALEGELPDEEVERLFNEYMPELSADDPQLSQPTMEPFAISSALQQFFADRLKVLLRDDGRRHDLVDAVFALGDDDLVRAVDRVGALSRFLGGDTGADLLAGYRRAVNILEAEARKGPLPAGEPRGTRACPSEEADLRSAVSLARREVAGYVAVEDFAAAMGALAALRAPVDAFFDKVLVNSADAAERDDRLRLLAQVRSTMDAVADFSRISG